jgi:protein TonB
MVKRVIILNVVVIIIIGCCNKNINNNKDSYISQNEDVDIIFAFESAPIYNGNIHEFISNSLHYPQTALDDSIEGRVTVSLIVEKDGTTSNHKLERGIREDVNKEALRVARLIRFEKPAMVRGKSIRCTYMVYITFSLQNINCNHK